MPDKFHFGVNLPQAPGPGTFGRSISQQRAKTTVWAIIFCLTFIMIRAITISLLSLCLLPAVAEAGYKVSVIDGNSGEVLFSKNQHQRAAPASLTKMINALVAVEEIPQSGKVTVGNYRPSFDEQQLGLVAGEKISRDDLLRAALINSDNDAAVALADAGGQRSRYVGLMNKKAQELGLTDTHFVHPAGMDERGQKTTAKDMAFLGRALLEVPLLKKIVAQKEAWLMSGARSRHILTTNHLLGNFTDGIKTGYTDQAGWSVVVSRRRDHRFVIASVLGAESPGQRWALASRMLDRGMVKIKKQKLVRKNQIIADLPNPGGQPGQVRASGGLTVWSSRKQSPGLISLPDNIIGPAPAGKTVGYLTFDSNKKVPLYLAQAVAAPTLLQKLPLLPLLIILMTASLWGLARKYFS